jgi:ribosomal protein L39E
MKKIRANSDMPVFLHIRKAHPMKKQRIISPTGGWKSGF